MVAVLAEALRLSNPLDVLTMRADVAVKLMMECVEINEIRKEKAGREQAANLSRGNSGKGYDERPDGTRAYRIDSMEKLHGFLNTGHV